MPATKQSRRTYSTSASADSVFGRFEAHDLDLDLGYTAPYRHPITTELYAELQAKADLFFDRELIDRMRKDMEQTMGVPTFLHTGQVGTYQGFRIMGIDFAQPGSERWTLSWPRNHGKNWFKDLYEQEWPTSISHEFRQGLERERNRMYRELLDTVVYGKGPNVPNEDLGLSMDFIRVAQKITSFGDRMTLYRGKPLTYAQQDYVARRLAARNQGIQQFNQALHDSVKITKPGTYRVGRKVDSEGVAHTTVVSSNTKPESTEMDREQLVHALTREMRKADQIEKELGDARRTVARHERTIECQGNRLVNSDAHLAQQMADNGRQKQTIYRLEAQVRKALDRPTNDVLRREVEGLRERCNTQLISLSAQEQQLKNQANTIETQRQTIGRLDARVRTQGDTIDRLAKDLEWARGHIGLRAPHLGDVSFGQAKTPPQRQERTTGLEPLVQAAQTSEPRQAYNAKPVLQRFATIIGNVHFTQPTDQERVEYLRAAQAAGKRIQVWHLNLYRGQRMDEVNSGNGQWDDIRGQTDFQCPAHLYRVHPEDL